MVPLPILPHPSTAPLKVLVYKVSWLIRTSRRCECVYSHRVQSPPSSPGGAQKKAHTQTQKICSLSLHRSVIVHHYSGTLLNLAGRGFTTGRASLPSPLPPPTAVPRLALPAGSSSRTSSRAEFPQGSSPSGFGCQCVGQQLSVCSQLRDLFQRRLHLFFELAPPRFGRARLLVLQGRGQNSAVWWRRRRCQ